MNCTMLMIGLALLAVPALANEEQPDRPGAFVLDHKVTDIDGNEVDLAEYHGKVLMIVNVASKCGLTPQYEQLVKIYHEYKERGFIVLGFPANNFMGQEPGTNEEIKTFCSTQFGADFPLFAKISVKGDDIHPLYKELTSEEDNPGYSGEIAWNFAKFLISREGRVVARFDPKTKPDEEEVLTAVQTELDKPDLPK